MSSHLSSSRPRGWSRLVRVGSLLPVSLVAALALADAGKPPVPNPANGNQAKAKATFSARVGVGVGGGAAQAAPKELVVYFGTYTGKTSQGIYMSRFDLSTGQVSEPELAAEISNPSFLALHPSGKYLYAVGELSNFNGKPGGAVTAFSIQPKTYKLTQLNQQSSQGAGPCHVTVDPSGKNVLLANYGGGSIAALPLSADGTLGEATAFVQHEGSGGDPKRQAKPHAHSINLDRSGRFAFAADLGLDKVLVYRFDAAKGTLTPNDPPAASVAPASGPRHFAFHPSGKFAYVINEMKSTVTAFSYDADKGVLTEIQTLSTLPENFKGNNSTAEVQVHPSGKFLYGSNRGHDSLAIFSIDEATGKLTAVGHQSTLGSTPRNFGIDPTGQYILAANQGSGTVVPFRVDQATGKLTATGQTINVGAPVCVKFLAVAP